MNYADKITERVHMSDILEMYGYKLNRNGFMICPFHNEKTASFKLYRNDTKYKCFGCGEGGGVIDFVKRLFDLNYNQAIRRINDDFSLGLFLTEVPSYRERVKQAKKRFEIRKAKEEKENADRQIEEEYWHYYDLLLGAERVIEAYAPKSENEPLDPLFVYALVHRSEYEFYLEQADIERMKKIERR